MQLCGYDRGMANDDRPILRLAHSPDPDDAFMWWPLFELGGKAAALETGRFRYKPVLSDIEALNQRAANDGDLEITAMSCAQYPHVKGRYAITACGSSMGTDYGPKLVARSATSLEQLRGANARIAVPGERTSAFAVLTMMLGKGNFQHEVIPFKEIIDVVARGDFEVGLVIHEGQLTYADAGLHLIEDVGRWWSQQENLPMPLGINCVRRDLEQLYGEGTLAEISAKLLESVRYALAHREQSIAYAMQYARDMTSDLADEFVELYVNDWTLDFGDVGRSAVQRFLNRCHEVGLTPDVAEVDFVAPAI